MIAAARTHWASSDDIEITLEANPRGRGSALRRSCRRGGQPGVAGLQAFDDSSLAFLGRAHSGAEGLSALDVAQRHFNRVNFDLIYALPGQDEDNWSTTLDRALGLGTGHLSLYQLTIEPGTRFAALHAAGKLDPLDLDHAAGLFELTAERTAAAGVPAYEISNHARPGEESRHNLTYWRHGDYAGVGPGAHGRRGGMRTVRHRKPENFLRAMARNGHGLAEEEALSARESADEALVMGLRLTEGIPVAELEERLGVPLVDRRATARLVASGHLEWAGERLRTTPAGRLLLDHILGEIAAR